MNPAGVDVSRTRNPAGVEDVHQNYEENHYHPVPKPNSFDLMVVRVRKDGTSAIARPCSDCMEILKLSGARFIYYTNEKGELMVEEASQMISTHKPSSRCAYEARHPVEGVCVNSTPSEIDPSQAA